MIKYADFVFYDKDYKGSLSIDLFNSLIVKASREIDRNINKTITQSYINNLSEIDQYKLKYATCQMVDYINAHGDIPSSANSISIDGVSISKGSSEEQKISKNEIRDNLPHDLIRYL